MAALPEDLQYTAEHEWIDSGSPATVGITSVAAEALGDIVFVELPEVGASLTAGAVFGEVESVKSVSELFSPVTGTVVEVNAALADAPETINSDPFGEGWLVRVEIDTLGPVLTAEEYAALTGGPGA
ncbi:glycine cleavage system H protein [Flavimobilis marinus]|uniref:Glycine cleavage system H protein n=2 Tax=Flavimobilis TaxID=2756312 RepID=A0A1I2HRI8_9MICO|nr:MULTISPECIES: glycine cleavage system protein GcvH [Flavimobilis]MBD9699111.1 glycine cleavage system protein GcvH [Flavimobilis rhizosphaerae]GHG48690.1 glycine cleavage system H protein [Flavimobilis marinus]SFF32148.1 glycine cleavage system H protein [Flavimobilis marinus]